MLFRILNILFLIIFLNHVGYCQSNKTDEIIRKDKSSIKGNIIQITKKNIEFNPMGDIPFLIIPKSEVSVVIKSDNTILTFEENDKINNQNDNISLQSRISLYSVNERFDKELVKNKHRLLLNEYKLNTTIGPIPKRVFINEQKELYYLSNNEWVTVYVDINISFKLSTKNYLPRPTLAMRNIQANDILTEITLTCPDFKISKQFSSPEVVDIKVSKSEYRPFSEDSPDIAKIEYHSFSVGGIHITPVMTLFVYKYIKARSGVWDIPAELVETELFFNLNEF